MTTRTRVPALGAEGWFTPDADEPTLLGRRCAACGTYAFPQADPLVPALLSLTVAPLGAFVLAVSVILFLVAVFRRRR